MTIYFDLETVPTEDPVAIAEIAAGITHPRSMSKAATIEKWEEEEKPGLVDEAVRRTSFDAAYGRICCIGWAVDDGIIYADCGLDEKRYITTFFDAVDVATTLYANTFVGHNITGFDLRFLWQRCVILGIKPPGSVPFAAKPWDKSVADTMMLWHPDRDRRISLDRLCRVLSVTSSKDDMDGSQVADAFRAKEYDKIATYCAADVESTRACYKRMVFADKGDRK